MKKERTWRGGGPIRVIEGGLSEEDYLSHQLARALEGTLILDRSEKLPPIIVFSRAPSNACGEKPLIVLNRTSQERFKHDALMSDVVYVFSPPDGFIQLEHVIRAEPMSLFNERNKKIGSAIRVVTREEAIDSYFIFYPDGSFSCHRHQAERTNSDDPDTA